MMTNQVTEPRIYIASLADYNGGTLHGVWVSLEGKDVADIEGEITAMLEASPFTRSRFAQQWGMKAEDWAIHDYEGFGSYRLSEWEDLEGIVNAVGAMEEHGVNVLDFAAAVGWSLAEIDSAEIEDSYAGEWDSFREYAEEYACEVMSKELKESVFFQYIDWERYARELEFDYFTTPAENGRINVWRSI